ncbi:hypothetical protein [Deferrisoma camini]|uniref:hypothetical protein n=1 Tax=Deferrisoma camini TaxID=1035120 RepID=UPI00046D1D45|nr:hypothetical protein [Deferrisoma camini]
MTVTELLRHAADQIEALGLSDDDIVGGTWMRNGAMGEPKAHIQLWPEAWMRIKPQAAWWEWRRDMQTGKHYHCTAFLGHGLYATVVLDQKPKADGSVRRAA